MRAAKLLSSNAAELAKSVELAACARGVEAYLAGGGSDNLAHDLALHVWPRAGPGTLSLNHASGTHVICYGCSNSHAACSVVYVPGGARKPTWHASAATTWPMT